MLPRNSKQKIDKMNKQLKNAKFCNRINIYKNLYIYQSIYFEVNLEKIGGREIIVHDYFNKLS